MKKYFLVLYLSIIPLFSLYAQEQPLHITNYVTESYWDIRSTHSSIQAPIGFVRDEDGFIEKKSGSMIRVEENTTPILLAQYQFLSSFDSVMADSLGQKLVEKMKLKINGMDALLAKLTYSVNDKDFISWRLIIGDENYTDVVVGTYTQHFANDLENIIRTSVLSTFFDKDKRLLPAGADPTISSSSSCNCHKK